MKIILAAPRGFCAGVNMAIESLDLAIRAFGTPIYVYHEIVHNKYVVDTFRGKGAVFVDHLTDVPPGSTLLFSAHGVSPEIRRLAQSYLQDPVTVEVAQRNATASTVEQHFYSVTEEDKRRVGEIAIAASRLELVDNQIIVGRPVTGN